MRGGYSAKGLAVVFVAVAFFQNKFENNIFGHQCQTVDPQYIHHDIGLVVKPV
jgi:hypothetical protein